MSAVLVSEDLPGDDPGAGVVRVLTLSRPEKLNALDTALSTELRDALVACDQDPTVAAVVLTGAGRGFCAGADLGEFSTLTPDQPAEVTQRAALTAELQALPTRIRVPVVAAAAGPAVGGGAGLMIACDMVVAADDLRFGYPEIRHDIVPALVMTGLVRHFGRKTAFELVTTGRLLSAAELAEAGVANRVVARGEELDAAVEIARGWAGRSSQALGAIKSLFYRVGDLPTDAAMRVGQDVNALMRSFRS